MNFRDLSRNAVPGDGSGCGSLLELLPTLHVESAPREVLLALLVILASKQAEVAARLAEAYDTSATERPHHDELLDVEGAALRLGVKPEWLYRRAGKLPFTVRLGERKLRFSARGIEAYIRRRRAD